MGEISNREDEWQRKAISAAIAEARKIVLGNNLLMHTPAGSLSDLQWGWILAAALFGWITTRCEQAIAEELDQQQAVRSFERSPSPDEIAVARAILPALADQADIEWSQPATAWSKDTMANFVLLVRQLLEQAQFARDRRVGGILRKSDFNEKTGDAIPF
ncbi:hypothetical protein ACRQ5Q_38325 [Bradyrhizobium sp. PMVTL-01]|uniref:hypothetical protein n=1 Tax=Bradyrhizobium sp. PMVTL-01 TaxID=3434999 RepID=UPI003F6F049F